MLGSVKNINLVNSRDKGYSSLHGKTKNPVSQPSVDGDNLKRSEALEFLLENKWQILELVFITEEKLSVTFLFSDIEFKTIVDFTGLNFPCELLYTISLTNEFEDTKKKLTAYLALQIADTKQLDNNDMKGLKTLLKELGSLKIKSELNVSDYPELNYFLDNIFRTVYNDFYYVTGCLFEFVTKITGMKINKTINKNGETLSLLKVKVENTDSAIINSDNVL